MRPCSQCTPCLVRSTLGGQRQRASCVTGRYHPHTAVGLLDSLVRWVLIGAESCVSPVACRPLQRTLAYYRTIMKAVAGSPRPSPIVGRGREAHGAFVAPRTVARTCAFTHHRLVCCLAHSAHDTAVWHRHVTLQCSACARSSAPCCVSMLEGDPVIAERTSKERRLPKPSAGSQLGKAVGTSPATEDVAYDRCHLGRVLARSCLKGSAS